MIKLSQRKIKLENVLLDLSTLDIRPKVTEQDLERYYNSFLKNIEEAGDYFKDGKAFDLALKDASGKKHPKFIAREPRYPFMWGLRTKFTPFDFLIPSKRRLNDEYFMCARCTVAMPRKNKVRAKDGENPLDIRLIDDVVKKFQEFPDYEGIIEVPNDGTPPETKSTTFHESLHYIISRYQAETGRSFVNSFIKEELPQLEKYQAEHTLHERVVEILTDKLLTHDPHAQFENRWTHHSLNNGFRLLVEGASAIATGLLLGTSIINPYLIPTVLVPGRIRDYAIGQYKKSKKEEILKPVEYPKFKI
jgi:hypothetical protein